MRNREGHVTTISSWKRKFRQTQEQLSAVANMKLDIGRLQPDDVNYSCIRKSLNAQKHCELDVNN